MLVAAVVYLSAGIWASAWQPREGRKGSIAVLGLVLAVGYYAKAVLFPLGIAFIAIAAWLISPNRLPIVAGGRAARLPVVSCTPGHRHLGCSRVSDFQ